MPAVRREPNTDVVADSPESMFARRARRVTRMTDMFWSANEVVNLGKRVHRMSDDELNTFQASASERDKRALAILDKLKELDPTIINRCVQAGSASVAVTKLTKKDLDDGQSNGKSEDMRKVRDEIVSWRKWTPVLVVNTKVDRGLLHLECAFYLSSNDVEWSDDEARNQFIAFHNPPMDSSLWPRFLWPDGKFDKTRPTAGMLRGELLLEAARAILFAPSATKAALKMRLGARGSRMRRRPIIGIAKAYQLTEVTEAFIAYTAVVTRHALTNEETFSDTCGGFDYIDFYNQLREYLEAPKYKRRTTRLLKWWNKELFSPYKLGENLQASELRKVGTLAAIDAEMEGEEEDQEEVDSDEEST